MAGLAGIGAAATLPGALGAATTGAPDSGPNVLMLDPAMSRETMQAQLDAIFRRQERAHFSDDRYAVLLKPGHYPLDINVGFFTQVAGLGMLPDAVEINGHVHVEADWMHGVALVNFWRCAENLAVRPPDGQDRWAVSQAAPYRRIHLHGNLALDDNGWSSGGFMADCHVSGTVESGTQQQWFTRNSLIGGWQWANWNMVFVGVEGAPATRFPTPPYTSVDAAPVIREKPFLHVTDDGGWAVFVPALRRDTRGVSWAKGMPAGHDIPLSRFLIATPATGVGRINAALASGMHLLLTPGIYRLAEPIRVVRPDTVVLGLGLATLLSEQGAIAMQVADVSGVTIAGLLFDAGPVRSPLLLQVGPRGSAAAHSANPTLLADVFFRVGGAAPGRVETCLEINSNNVIADHLWVWRADHGDREHHRVHVGWTENTADHGVIVDGKDVTAYGLFVEHFQQYQTWWRGERGRTFFYQNELPYDPPSQAAYMDGQTRGWAAYKVADHVDHHHAIGMGIYANFTADPSIVLESAIEAPRKPDVTFVDITTISLGGGMGTVAHLVNDAGAAARKGADKQTLVRYPPA
ncbi:MAG: adenylyl cyclase [Sphingomonas sp.]